MMPYPCRLLQEQSGGLEKGNPAWRPDPQLPASVLKEGMRALSGNPLSVIS